MTSDLVLTQVFSRVSSVCLNAVCEYVFSFALLKTSIHNPQYKQQQSKLILFIVSNCDTAAGIKGQCV